MKKTILLFLTLLLVPAALRAADDAVPVIPSSPYDRFIIFETLAIFWVGIIGLVIIIRMKLREIERTQKMNLDKEEKNTPLLD